MSFATNLNLEFEKGGAADGLIPCTLSDCAAKKKGALLQLFPPVTPKEYLASKHFQIY